MQRRAFSKFLAVIGSRAGAVETAAAAPGTKAAAAAATRATSSVGISSSSGFVGGVAAHYLRAFSAQAAASKSTADVPLGHHDSDLSSVACHIGLGRRRDLTMREDLALWKNGSSRLTLADVFRVRVGVCGRVCSVCSVSVWNVCVQGGAPPSSHVCPRPPTQRNTHNHNKKHHQTNKTNKQGHKALLVGFPGGKVCTEKHIPGYVEAIPDLKKAGVGKVVCVTVGDPEAVRKWASDNGFDRDDTALCVLADKDQGFMRLLGLELGASGPPCQRFAGVVDNGILLRLKVEASPGDLRLTHVQSMLEEFKKFFG